MIPEKLRMRSSEPWKKWGPYLSERQWGTVREDYSEMGNAWDYFSHDQSRSRAYLWGEDGLGGISDDQQYLCFALVLWNGQDPILKERLFGLTNSEGNHGEDVKEYYFYLDNTPTHAYMKYLYKYPQSAFPYADLVKKNRSRNYSDQEYELIDTGVFDHNRYFDIFVEYAKANPEEIWIRIGIENRSSEAAILHLLPTLWFRNTWGKDPNSEKPILQKWNDQTIVATHPILGQRYLSYQKPESILFTNNETNHQRLFGISNDQPYVKDAFHRYLIDGDREAINPDQQGTKACFYEQIMVDPLGSAEVFLCLSDQAPAASQTNPQEIFVQRREDSDQFYSQLIPPQTSADQAQVMRQALAGLLWTKQFYYYDVERWAKTDSGVKDQSCRTILRNQPWFHLYANDILLMPDKWEYPWFAAWDHAFHAMIAAMVDIDLAKQQLLLLTQDRYLHPNGQLPAYEWNFSDVNPPVHATAVWRVYLIEKVREGRADQDFLRRSFHKLLLNFTWWVNRKDMSGKNVFEGGFLGLDNIGVFDRSSPLPTGGSLEQADGSAWMAMYCLDMLTIALELAQENSVYQEIAAKFYKHFFYIAGAMDRVGIQADELWDEEDGFFYDLLRMSDGTAARLKVRSMVGLIPLLATAVIEADQLENLPEFTTQIQDFQRQHPELFENVANPEQPGVGGRRLLSVLNENKLRRILSRMLDESRFLSSYGIRSLSRHHLEHPYTFYAGSHPYRVAYEPAESTTGMFGGNSNWRGPIWMPINAMLIQALVKLYTYYGDDFRVPCPTESGAEMTLWEVSQEISRRLISIFCVNGQGRRPVYGDTERFQSDPHWRDLILFYEYFHGDNGAGIGASHQTGWTAAVARMIQFEGASSAQGILSEGLKPGIDTNC